MLEPGILYIVPTPIGNLGDITLRAVEALKSVEVIACEDTRHVRTLLDRYGITNKPLVSYFDANEKKRAPELVADLKAGKKVALVSDAGTPGIADPGYRLIHQAIESGIKIEVLPGACAVITALVASGLPTHKFIFEGFFPVKAGEGRRRLEALKAFGGTAIFYESPYRVLKTLKLIRETLGEVEMAVARELSKKFEEVVRGPVSDIERQFSARKPLGEFVILLNLNEQ